MRKLALAAALILSASAALAEAPRIIHATLTTATAGPDLASQVRRAPTTWIGYSIPAGEPYRVMCCFDQWRDFRGGTCRLSGDASSFTNVDREDLRPAAGSFAIFYRVEGGEIAQVRSYSL